MKHTPNLLGKLMDYGNSSFYPFHMPGHKRKVEGTIVTEFPNPFLIDITEIEGFDNLHHPQGILKESMEWAAEIYGADKTYYLINGSSSGILSAVFGTTTHGGSILISRNCHKSAYHAVFLNHLKTEYIYPQIMCQFGLQGGLLPDELEKMLINHPELETVLVVSPTYDGIVSDIKKLAEIAHRYKCPLIVDEAHGAHFSYGKEVGFPISALELGADIVIQSLHKTLPSFTQTAIMHVKDGYVDMAKIDRYVHMFQSSSPSYVLMVGIENCIKWMNQEGRKQMVTFAERIKAFRAKMSHLKHLKLVPMSVVGYDGIYDLDISKIVVSSRGTELSGAQLLDILRTKYYLELEMCGPDYVTAITTVLDTEDGLLRLYKAFEQIDGQLEFKSASIPQLPAIKISEVKMTIAEAMDAAKREVFLTESEGMISGEFVYVYPPGIPIVAPGEILKREFIDLILEYKRIGLPVQGMEDSKSEKIWAVLPKSEV